MTTVLPFLSVLLGAWITYAINVRQRRRTKVEDIFHEALAAVAVTQASRSYVTTILPWEGASADEMERFNAEIRRDGNMTYLRSLVTARSALARASVYDDALRQYLVTTDREAGQNLIYLKADEILARLRRNIDEPSGLPRRGKGSLGMHTNL